MGTFRYFGVLLGTLGVLLGTFGTFWYFWVTFGYLWLLIENLLFEILNFEKGARNKKGFLVIEREFLFLILKRFFEIENSRLCLASCKRKRILSGLLDMTMKPGDTAGLWFPVKCGIFSIWSDWVMIQQIMGEHRQ